MIPKVKIFSTSAKLLNWRVRWRVTEEILYERSQIEHRTRKLGAERRTEPGRSKLEEIQKFYPKSARI